MPDSLETEQAAPLQDISNSPDVVPVKTPFIDQMSNPLIIPVERTIFNRLSKYLENKGLEPKTVRNAVIFVAAAGVAAGTVAVAKHYLDGRRKTREIKLPADLPPLTASQLQAYTGSYETDFVPIMAYLISKGMNKQDAEDLTSETFHRFRRKFPKYIINPAHKYPYRPLVYRIAHNLHANWLRDYYRRPVTSILLDDNRERSDIKKDLRPVESLVEEEIEEEKARMKVGQAIINLIPTYQEIILLKTIIIKDEEESSANKIIAEILGTTEGAVKSRYHRACKQLAKELKKIEGVIPG